MATFLNPGAAQAPEPAYLIINADDYAYFDCVSRGILACADAGTVTATGVFANSPLLDEHAAWLEGYPALDVGVHLNLTDRMPLTRPLTSALSGCHGRFPGKFAISRAILARRIPVHLVRDEWRAQIERCLANNLRPRFLNSHEHIHMLPPLYPVAVALADEYGIGHVRFSTPEWPRTASASALMRDGIMAVLAGINRLRMVRAAPGFLGMSESGRLSSQFLSQLLPKLRPGRIYELMCHPGSPATGETVDERILSYHDWDLERRTLSDPQTKVELARHNIRLIGYRHLRITPEGLRVYPQENGAG